MAKSHAHRLLPLRSGTADATYRVFCLPHAGGGASSFRGWLSDPPPGAEICAVQMPGRESRIDEPFATSIPELAESLVEALLPYLDLPYVIVGNSMGALTAFELAGRLQSRYSLPPVRLVAAATRPPGTRLDLPAISGLSDLRFAEAIQERHGGIPADIMGDPGHLAVFLPALRADMAMFESYQPTPGLRLACPITGAVGADDPGMAARDLLGWSDFTDGPFACVELPGDHFALLSCREAVLAPVHAEMALVQPAAVAAAGSGPDGHWPPANPASPAH